MTFAEWLDARYTVMSADYRRNLSWIVGTCRGYAEGNIWEPRHTAIAIELLRGVSRGTLGTHPEWDEEVFRAARRPDGNEILRMAEEEIKHLEK